MVPILVFLSAVLCCAVQALAAQPPVQKPTPAQSAVPRTTLKLSPDTIQMDTFYNGAPIRMEGDVPAGSHVVVIVRGESKDEVFNKKGRIGPIWINVDKIHVTGTPSLFLRFTSEEMHGFLDRKTIDAYELDELSVKERMHIRTNKGEPGPEYRELIENSYLDLKKKDLTYRRVANRVHIVPDGATEHYTVAFNWPKTAPPGRYQIEVYACRDRAIIGQAATTLRLVEVGFPAFMVSLAHQHPWEYGLLAVFAAVCAGFGIDAVASRLRRPARARPRKVLVPAPLAPARKEAPVREDEHVHH
jgi:uncharacterized protein (TIGR02186 family)